MTRLLVGTSIAGWVTATVLAVGCERGMVVASRTVEESATGNKNHPVEVATTGEREMMTVDMIVERVKRGDRSVLLETTGIPAEAAAPLLRLLGDNEAEVRELALASLHHAGGLEARRGVLESLNDEAEAVRSIACRHLPSHEDPSNLPILLREVVDNTDAYVRENVALSLGRIGDVEAAQTINKQLERETDTHAQQAMRLALARLGDPPMRDAYLSRLTDQKPEVRARALEDFAYLRDEAFLPHMMPLLDDLRNAKNVAPAGHSFNIRVCDVAVQVLDQYYRQPFEFEVEFAKRYTTQELATAKSVLSSKLARP